MNKRWGWAALALAALLLAGCAARVACQPPQEAEHTVREVRVIRPQMEQKEATLYLGMAGQYGTYPFPYQGEVTPDQLIAAIGDLTGWDLRLDGPVLQDSSGITVTFAADCALFTGPPEPQKADFFVYSAEELCAVLLDSVCRTIQWNLVNPNLGDPKSLPVYFRTAQGDLCLEDIGFTQPESLSYGGLLPGGQVLSGHGRLLRVTPEGAGVFDLDGAAVSMVPYDSDIASTLSQVTPGLAVTVVYLQGEGDAVLTGVYHHNG